MVIVVRDAHDGHHFDGKRDCSGLEIWEDFYRVLNAQYEYSLAEKMESRYAL